MNTVWKYLITFTCELKLPAGAVALRAGLDPQGSPCIWFRVDPEAPVEKRQFRVVGTGHDVGASWAYISSFDQGPLIWHAFEVL